MQPTPQGVGEAKERGSSPKGAQEKRYPSFANEAKSGAPALEVVEETRMPDCPQHRLIPGTI